MKAQCRSGRRPMRQAEAVQWAAQQAGWASHYPVPKAPFARPSSPGCCGLRACQARLRACPAHLWRQLHSLAVVLHRQLRPALLLVHVAQVAAHEETRGRGASSGREQGHASVGCTPGGARGRPSSGH